MICLAPNCDREAKVRSLCKNHYRSYYRAGKLTENHKRMFISAVHKLSEINPDTKIAVCANCGPVRIRSRGKSGWCCRIDGNQKEARRRAKLRTERLALLKSQCEICGSKEDLEFDHEHGTDRYRGTLCHYCNKAVGFLNDDADLAQKAVDYLRRVIPEDSPTYGRFSGYAKKASRPLRQASLQRQQLI